MDRAFTLCLASVCLLASGPSVRADELVSYGWGYSFEPGPTPVHSYLKPNGWATVIVPGNGQSSNMSSVAGTTTSISTEVAVSTNASIDDPIRIGKMPFTESIKVTDNASGQSDTLTFHGFLRGKVWDSGSTLHPVFVGPMTQTVDINHHLYTVSFSSFDAPGGNNAFGEFNFKVAVAHNPEPSTLILAGIGLPLLGFKLRRRKKQLHG